MRVKLRTSEHVLVPVLRAAESADGQEEAGPGGSVAKKRKSRGARHSQGVRRPSETEGGPATDTSFLHPMKGQPMPARINRLLAALALLITTAWALPNEAEPAARNAIVSRGVYDG